MYFVLGDDRIRSFFGRKADPWSFDYFRFALKSTYVGGAKAENSAFAWWIREKNLRIRELLRKFY